MRLGNCVCRGFPLTGLPGPQPWPPPLVSPSPQVPQELRTAEGTRRHRKGVCVHRGQTATHVNVTAEIVVVSFAVMQSYSSPIQ